MAKTKFKKTEIGMIPEDWEVKELNSVASYITEKINLDKINTLLHELAHCLLHKGSKLSKQRDPG